MNDDRIIELFFERSEDALQMTREKYHAYCSSIARGILGDEGEADECVNDAYLKIWQSIPPERPAHLSVYIGRITRNLAIDRLRALSAEKRDRSQTCCLDELSECIPEQCSDPADTVAVTEALNVFLRTLSKRDRRIFLRRYWYQSSVKEISDDLCIGQSAVKMSLSRSRKRLRDFLTKEEIWV